MSAEVHDYISVSEKLKSFGISLPSGLTILPSNLATATSIGDLRQHVESDTVRALLTENKIAYGEIFDDDHQPPYLQQYSFEWFGPTLLVSANLLVQDPNLLSVTMGVIANYLFDLFKRTTASKATLDVIVEKSDGSCQQIHYSGPSDGLSHVAELAKKLVEKE
jgi:hypothetical protein